MNDNIVDEVKLEKQIKHAFGIDLEIKQFITHNMPVSSDGIGSIFITPKHQLFLYMTFHSKVKLGDVSKVVKKLNLLVERYLPPRGKNDYFNEIAREKFINVFPGRAIINSDDLSYYRTLVPYSPCLIQIAEVKNGLIKQFDVDAHTGYRPNVKFIYKLIKAQE